MSGLSVRYRSFTVAGIRWARPSHSAASRRFSFVLSFRSRLVQFASVESVTIRDLRNHGREVIDRVVGGERLIVTRLGRPVAELRPLAPRGLDAATLLERWKRLPPVDAVQFRRDLDQVLDSAL